MSVPEVSVVVATRDRRARLEGLLASLRAQTLDRDRFEVVVVDDGSTDDTAAALERERESGELRLEVISGTGAGPADARNRGWRAARGELVAFTDDDCEAATDWLERGLAAWGGDALRIVQGPTMPIERERHRLGPFARTRRIEAAGPWFETCNIFYPRSLLERLDGFDERFAEALGEDTDLGWRARELGGELVWAPDARVEHAVEEVEPAQLVRGALIGVDSVLAFDRHPGLREQTLSWGVVRNPALPRLGLALAGVALARRHPAALALALPYCRNLAARVLAADGGLQAAPWYAAADVAAGVTSLRGSVRHRRLVL
jgi:glycosyltransferase involved in cell wall biosynthesis